MDKRYARFSRLLIDRPHRKVLRVVMNRPDKLNAADGEMHSDLTEIWRVIDADPSVNAVLLTGAGKAFSAGGDLDRVKNAYQDHDVIVDILEEIGKHRLLLDRLTQKSIEFMARLPSPGTAEAAIRARVRGGFNFGRIEQIVCHSFCRFSCPRWVLFSP